MHPNFLIVGAMKGGSSSLLHTLRQHPDIYMPPREVHFFDSDERFTQGMSDYERSFSGWQGEQTVGEKTPTYSYQQNVPGRIASMLPHVKLIWLLREPVARAYSHYWFFISMGKERLSFERALEREGRGKTSDFTMCYLDRSIYGRQIERYLQYFPLEQMLFLLFEEYLVDNATVLARICRFLDVDDGFVFPEKTLQRNQTFAPRSVTLQWTLARIFRRRGVRIMRLSRRLNRRPVAAYPPLAPETRRTLVSFFEPHNQELGDMTGLDLTAWENAQ